MRPRFSLRTFLILVSLVGVALGGAAAWRQSIFNSSERHVRAMKQLNYREPSTPLFDKALSPRYVDFARTWIHPRAFEVKERVCAARDFWTPQHLAQLKDLHGLTSVTCSFSLITQQDAEALCAIPQLRQLSVKYDMAEAGAPEILAAIPTLEELRIDAKLENSFFTAIRQHPTLRSFEYRGPVTLSRENLEAIAANAHLTTFVHAKRVDVAEALAIFAKPHIEDLSLKLQTFDAAALRKFEGGHLKRLALFYSQFDEGTLEAISKIPHLQRLELYGKVTCGEAEFASLKSCVELEDFHAPLMSLSAEQIDLLTSLPKLKSIHASKAEGASPAVVRFLDSKKGRSFNSP